MRPYEHSVPHDEVDACGGISPNRIAGFRDFFLSCPLEGPDAGSQLLKLNRAHQAWLSMNNPTSTRISVTWNAISSNQFMRWRRRMLDSGSTTGQIAIVFILGFFSFFFFFFFVWPPPPRDEYANCMGQVFSTRRVVQQLFAMDRLRRGSFSVASVHQGGAQRSDNWYCWPASDCLGAGVVS